LGKKKKKDSGGDWKSRKRGRMREARSGGSLYTQLSSCSGEVAGNAKERRNDPKKRGGKGGFGEGGLSSEHIWRRRNPEATP